jgi:SHS2 domain-containing protein
MGYRWVEHTAEVELEIEAPTEEAVFSDALHALGELIGDGSRGDPVACDVVVAGREPAVLLVRWLDELVYRAETEDLVPEDVERIELAEPGLRATVRCHRGHPRHLVKGATYHRLAFERSDRGLCARVVLDV